MGAVATAGLKPNPANSKHLINESWGGGDYSVHAEGRAIDWPGARKRTSFWRSQLG